MALVGVARDHFEHPRHASGLLAPAATVGTGVAGKVHSGSYVVFQVRMDEQGRISTARWECMGPPAAIAAASWLSERLQGLSLADAAGWTALAIGDELALEPEALSGVLVVEEALKAALGALDTS